MADTHALPRRGQLHGHALFAALLAMAGLPIYIHAPKFYADAHGVSLAALGLVLFFLRLLDFVQDPALGWLAARAGARRGRAVALAGLVMALAMLGLFAIAPPVAPLVWFALMLTALFSAFSFLTITFYAQGVRRGESLGAGGHLRVAAWRETGALAGVCLAAVAPTVLLLGFDAPYAVFAMGFAGLALVALLAMAGEWRGRAPDARTAPLAGFHAVLRDALARRLLLLALLNALPVAITSTLFLFFVESRLAAPGWEGPLLVLFFLAAAASVPGWSRAALRLGARPVLLAGMVLAILSFAFAVFLGPGDVLPFALICLASGAALGADMSLLSAIFARRMAVVLPEAAEGFGLWSFVSKATLALAALLVFPLLDVAGFVSGAENTAGALLVLGLLYALLPCLLKLLALALLAATPLKET